MPPAIIPEKAIILHITLEDAGIYFFNMYIHIIIYISIYLSYLFILFSYLLI